MAPPFKMFSGMGQESNGHGGCLGAVGLEEGQSGKASWRSHQPYGKEQEFVGEDGWEGHRRQ